MTVQSYLERAFLAPVVLPLLMIPALVIEGVPELLGMAAIVLVMSLVFGGIPYIVFAVLLLRWLRDRDERTWHRATWLAPPLFAAVLAAGLALWSLLAGAFDGRRLAETASYFAVWFVGIGYFYVLLVHAVRLLLVRARLVRNGPETGRA